MWPTTQLERTIIDVNPGDIQIITGIDGGYKVVSKDGKLLAEFPTYIQALSFRDKTYIERKEKQK